jgi:hypothetical protein
MVSTSSRRSVSGIRRNSLRISALLMAAIYAHPTVRQAGFPLSRRGSRDRANAECGVRNAELKGSPLMSAATDSGGRDVTFPSARFPTFRISFRVVRGIRGSRSFPPFALRPGCSAFRLPHSAFV